MKRIFFITLLAVVVGVGISCYAFAKEETYLIGVEDTAYYPHYSVNKGEYIGFAREALDIFSKKYGYKFVYKPLPVMRLHQNFIKKESDFLYPNNTDWLTELKKDTKIYYSNPLVNVIDGVMVLPENKGKKLKYLATIQGFTLPAYEALIKSNKVKISESYEFKGLFESVMRNYADGLYITIDCGNYHLRTVLQKPDALVFDASLPYDIASHMLSSIKYPEIIEKFNSFLKEEKAVIDKLKDKYQIMDSQQSEKF